MSRTMRVLATTLALLVGLSLGGPVGIADDHEVPPTKLKIGGKKRPGRIQAAAMVEPTETDGIPTCTPNDTVFGGQWPKPLKLEAKRYRAKAVLSTSRLPETLEVERRVSELPPPPGSGIEGKEVPHTLAPIKAGGATVSYLVKFRVRVPRKNLYLQLAAKWPDEDHCDGDFAVYGWVLRAKGT